MSIEFDIATEEPVPHAPHLKQSPFVFRTVSCNAWRDDYKRFIYSWTLKNAPVLYGPEEIERIIGEQPPGCDRPGRLSDEDIERFRAEGIGPNYFEEQMRGVSAGAGGS